MINFSIHIDSQMIIQILTAVECTILLVKFKQGSDMERAPVVHGGHFIKRFVSVFH